MATTLAPMPKLMKERNIDISYSRPFSIVNTSKIEPNNIKEYIIARLILSLFSFPFLDLVRSETIVSRKPESIQPKN